MLALAIEFSRSVREHEPPALEQEARWFATEGSHPQDRTVCLTDPPLPCSRSILELVSSRAY
jgi:hypothetical protein